MTRLVATGSNKKRRRVSQLTLMTKIACVITVAINFW